MSSFWHLAIECSSPGGSVALLKNSDIDAQPIVIRQICLPVDRGSVQTLAPAIRDQLGQTELRVRDLQFLSVTVGPGSFTGLRVGLATAKMLAMACDKPVVPVDTLAAIAQRFADDHHGRQDGRDARPLRLVTAINAYRKQVFTASWLIDNQTIHNARPPCVEDAQSWSVNPWGAADQAPSVIGGANAQAAEEQKLLADVWVSGSALQVFPLQMMPASPFRMTAAELWQPMATDVGFLGWQAYRRGGGVAAAELAANYLRESAAEEKRRQNAPP